MHGTPHLDQLHIIETLREYIRTEKLPPGELTSVKELAERFQVSRTLMREALVRLEEAGMVSFERNRGVRINRMSLRDIMEIYQMRLQLEPPATFRAVRRIGPETLSKLGKILELMHSFTEDRERSAMMGYDIAFHDIILRTAGNYRLADIVKQAREAVIARHALTSRPVPEVVDEHEPILEAMRRQNPSEARAAMTRHIISTGTTLFQEKARWSPDADSIDMDWTAGIDLAGIDL